MGFLSLFRKSSRASSHQSLPPALFSAAPSSMSTGAWATAIQGLAESEDCRLGRIVHCKAKSSRDEFLLVHVRHPSGKVAVVLASRDASFDPRSAYEHVAPSYASGTGVRALGVVPSRDRIRLASDGAEVSLARHVPGGWAEVHTVSFPKASQAPSVAHLAVLLAVLGRHVMSPGASPEMRGGWLAYCVAEVMREVFVGKSRPNKKWVRVPYGGMKVEGRDNVDTIIREFTPAWDTFSRQQMGRMGVRSTECSAKCEKGKKKKADLDSFATMLRTMEP